MNLLQYRNLQQLNALGMNLKILIQFLILLDSYYVTSEQNISKSYYYFSIKIFSSVNV